MNTHVFLITAKTNLHVGNENGGDFIIVDKAIQRDPLTSLPCINSSSLKGALKEYCCHLADMKGEIKRLFGSDKTSNKDDANKGEAIFFDAKLLFLPQQDKDSLFHYVTSNEVIGMMNDRIRLFDPSFDYKKPADYGGKKVEFATDSISTLCDNDSLPIIARNALDNGESKNLWYEQVLPAETVLYTIIREEKNVLGEKLKDKIVQIGANATIGYGYCKFTLLKTIKED